MDNKNKRSPLSKAIEDKMRYKSKRVNRKLRKQVAKEVELDELDYGYAMGMLIIIGLLIAMCVLGYLGVQSLKV